MRSTTRKNSSDRSSQRGMRWGPGLWPAPEAAWRSAAGRPSGAEMDTAMGGMTAPETEIVPFADPGRGAGLAGRGGDVISGCWAILWFRAISPNPIDPQAFKTGGQFTTRFRDTVLQRYHSDRRGEGQVGTGLNPERTGEFCFCDGRVRITAGSRRRSWARRCA